MRKIYNILQKLRGRYSYVMTEDSDQDLGVQQILLIGNKVENSWAVALLCPCGCKEKIFLNTLEEDEPNWKINFSWIKGISVSPSIWRTKGCNSHFWLQNGRIEWAYSN